MRSRRVAQAIEQARRAVDQRLHRRILAIENAQRIGVQAALRIGVEHGLYSR